MTEGGFATAEWSPSDDTDFFNNLFITNFVLFSSNLDKFTIAIAHRYSGDISAGGISQLDLSQLEGIS